MAPSFTDIADGDGGGAGGTFANGINGFSEGGEDGITQNGEGSGVVIVENIAEISQHPDFPTGCESVALCILLKHYGVEVSVRDIVDALPKGPAPHRVGSEDFGANPEKEFVGSPDDPRSYGVFEGPIAEVAETFREGAKAEKGADLEKIKRLLEAGSPVMAWCAMDGQRIEFRSGWRDYETGEEVVWGSNEHAVVVYGARGGRLLISDPNTGTKREVDEADFARGFDALGGRVVYWEG